MSTHSLLRKYVQEVLKEDDGGTYGDVMSAAAGMSPYGMRFGSNEDLYKIFIKPFVDVVDTATGKTKELSQKTQTLIHVAFETAMTTLIPTLTDSYKEIFASEKERLDKIKEEYKEVYQSNWDAFRDNDPFCTAFCYAPAMIVTAKLIQTSPRTAIDMISVLTGGSIDPWLKKVKDKFGLYKSPPPKTGLNFTGKGGKGVDYGGGGYGGFDGMGAMEGVIREDNSGEKSSELVKLLTNPKLIEKIEQSPIVKKMEQEGKAMVRNTLGQVFKQAQGVLKANSLQDLQQKSGVKLKGLEKLQQVPEQERQKVEQTLLSGAKKSMKEFYVKNLEGQLKSVVDSGVPENSPYAQDYQHVIQKIKAL